jgi:hypothetical protein
MDKKIIKTREVMHDRHLELDGMATVKQALDTMKAEQSDVVIEKTARARCLRHPVALRYRQESAGQGSGL